MKKKFQYDAILFIKGVAHYLCNVCVCVCVCERERETDRERERERERDSVCVRIVCKK